MAPSQQQQQSLPPPNTHLPPPPAPLGFPFTHHHTNLLPSYQSPHGDGSYNTLPHPASNSPYPQQHTNPYLPPPGPPFHGPQLGPLPTHQDASASTSNPITGNLGQAQAGITSTPTGSNAPTSKPKAKTPAKPRARPGSKSGPKTSKPKAGSARSAASKSGVSKPSSSSAKDKLRPQFSRHLTPSLRAAIITLKVATNKSFKDIGDFLAIPAFDSDDEEGAAAHAAANAENHPEGSDSKKGKATITQQSGQDATASSSTTGQPSTPSLAPPITTQPDSTIDPNLDPTLASTSTDPNAAASTSATTNPIAPSQPLNPSENPNAASGSPSTKPLLGPTGTRPKRRPHIGNTRRPIPRNTVAGIFKRATIRAGTETDIWKLLSQTGRQPGSGRPRKGQGKKDREREEREKAEQEGGWRRELEGVVNGQGQVVGLGKGGDHGGLFGDGEGDGDDGGLDLDEDIDGTGDVEGDGLDGDGDGDGDGGDEEGWEDDA